MDKFLHYLNSLNSKIQFTLERETDGGINFLDLRISRLGGSIEFDIYRKPTHTDVTIPMDSLHPLNHKMAAYNAMIHRAFTIPISNENLKKELNIIKHIATNNGFNLRTIDRLVSKKLKKLALNQVYSEKEASTNSYKTLTYYGSVSERIANILRKQNIEVTFRSPTSLSRELINNKHKLDRMEKSGVYKMFCDECDSVYIGQTGRDFQTRKKEHLHSYKTKKTDSTFANHLLEENHRPSKKFEVLHLAEKGARLTLLESLEIYKNKTGPNNLLNDQTDLAYSSFFNVINN